MYVGSRIDGGFDVQGEGLASSTSAAPTVLVSSGFFAAGGAFESKGLTITQLIWNRTGGAVALTLINSEDNTRILSRITSSIILDNPKIGSKNGNGISAIVEGPGSSLTLVGVPEKDAQRHLTL